MAEQSLEERQTEMRERLSRERRVPKARVSKLPVAVSNDQTTVDASLEKPSEVKLHRPQTISRQALYDLIWKEPVLKIARRFGVSDVAVAKACRRHRIPLPGRGYWARLASGQKLNKTRLPAPDGGTDHKITFSPPQRRDPPDPPTPVQSSLHVAVPATTRNLHPIAEQTYVELQKQVSSKERYYGNDWGRTSPRPGLLDVRVTPTQIHRSIRIMSAILNAALKQGYTVKVGEGPEHRRHFKAVHIVVEGVPLTLGMFEPARQKKHVPTASEQREIDRGHGYSVLRHDFHSTGKLQLSLSPPRFGGHVWHDTRDQKLEDMLGAVVEMMLKMSKSEHDYRKREAIEAQRRAEVERRRYEEELRVKRLEKQLAAWKRAAEVRSYATAVEAAVVEKHGRVDPDNELGRWIAWIRRYAEYIDPSRREDLATEPRW